MGPTGSPCTTSTLHCAGNASVTACFVNWSSGYCTQTCSSASCQPGSSCSPYVINGSSYCLQNCTWNGGQGDCRSDYVCDRYLVNGTDQATCIARCPTFACAANTTCDSNGFCCGKPYYRCCSSGAACPGGGTCQSGYCLP
jgi:hypothetical protein